MRSAVGGRKINSWTPSDGLSLDAPSFVNDWNVVEESHVYH